MPNKKGKVRTRSLSGPLGSPAALSEVGGLHDTRDVLSAVRYESQQADCPEESDAIEKVINQVKGRFKMVNPFLPLLEKRVIVQKLERLLDSDKKYCNKKLTGKQLQPFSQKFQKILTLFHVNARSFPAMP